MRFSWQLGFRAGLKFPVCRSGLVWLKLPICVNGRNCYIFFLKHFQMWVQGEEFRVSLIKLLAIKHPKMEPCCLLHIRSLFLPTMQFFKYVTIIPISLIIFIFYKKRQPNFSTLFSMLCFKFLQYFDFFLSCLVFCWHHEDVSTVIIKFHTLKNILNGLFLFCIPSCELEHFGK